MKQLELTPRIEAMLRKAVGPDADLTKLAVYEATLLNDQPIRKRHPLYEGAIVNPSTLRAIEAAINEESYPVHLNHETYDMNIGRIFHAELGAGQELRGLFFVSKDDKNAHLVDSGIVDQVSVNFLARNAYCSSCSFDYLNKEEANFENIYSGTCGNGHKLGENGCHVQLEGLQHFSEMSLVPRGGARGARIHGPTQARLSDEITALADGIGVDTKILMLNASAQDNPVTTGNQEPDMPNEDFAAQLGPLNDQIVELRVKGEQQSAELTLANTKLETANTALTSMTASRDDLQTKLDAAEAKVTELTDGAAGVTAATPIMLNMAKSVGKLVGVAEADIPTGLVELSAFMDEHKDKVAAAFVVGGKSKQADADTKLSVSANRPVVKTSRRQ